MKTELTHGATYNLGCTEAKYDANRDAFDGGNWSVHRSETIYADKADSLFMRDVRAREIARNKI